MRITILLVIITVVFLGLVQTGMADTVTDFNTALETLTDDFSETASWVNKQLAKSTGFGAGGTIQRPGAVKAFPGFEIGVTGGLSVAVDLNKLVDINTYAISSDFLDFPPFFFVQTGMIYGKIGLLKLPSFGKIDLGAGISSYSIDIQENFTGKFTQWQLEGRIQPNLSIPFDLSLALGVGNMKGNYRLQHTHTEEIASIEYNGSTYSQNLDTTVFMSSDWNVTAYYAKVVISKNLFFITPYAGIGLQTAIGNVNTVVGASGTLMLDPLAPGSNMQDTLTLKGFNSTPPRNFDFRLLGGVELTFLPFISLNISGEYGQDVYAASVGLIISVF